ncbi:molybdate ABC transporter substrate-binding protein [Nocardioides sp. Y6]|uniref:Molybdate ABC transporter substrate-binding protein n=1 Tax=Nocardioides malaquae TaxID=2773426 RepID=A0ABR9RW03_9ACTN|nr:molybdate ABC transporter substrate-binding protein [Nocardioides malaquae]MBE7325739.1 molybdate ABC transporter substrate-binding protein [Nocardioides malaquae]
MSDRRRGSGPVAALATSAAVVLVVGLTGCTSAEESRTTTLTVHAAASLSGTFTELGELFEAEHDDVDVVFSFAGSSDLAAQLEQGAPADVFASADTTTMDRVVDAGLVDHGPVAFAANTLRIAVPPGNPAGVTGLADLTRDGVQSVVCAPQVPCGLAARELLRSADLDLRPVSEEQSVSDVLAKVAVGEADAGLVYVTDVLAGEDRVDGVTVPQAADVVTTYPVATLTESDQPDLAKAFLDLVVGPRGRQVLDDAGFARP